MLEVIIEIPGKRPEILGPFARVERGAYGIFVGVRPDGSREDLFEITTGHGGYCDTCAYDYVSVIRHDPLKVKKRGHSCCRDCEFALDDVQVTIRPARSLS